MASGTLARALVLGLALAPLLVAAQTPQNVPGAIPPDVASRWSLLNPKTWNITLLKASMPLLKLPPGFKISLYYDQGLMDNARSMAVSDASVWPGGPVIVYVSSKMASKVYALVDNNGDGVADRMMVLINRIESPQGMDYYKGDLYVSGFSGVKGMVWKLKNVDSYVLRGQMYPTPPPDVVTSALPGERWHGDRYMRFGPNGLLYIAIGAPCNICYEAVRNGIKLASIYMLNVTSGALTYFAGGLRNVVGMDWHPDTKELYFTENGRDNYGENLPDCVLARAPIVGMFFGFPLCMTNGSGDPFKRPPGPGTQIPDPKFSGKVNCSAFSKWNAPPLQALGPHTAPLGMRFYKRDKNSNWPASFDRTIIIAMHGSADRKVKIGYRLVTVKLENDGRMPNPRAVSHEPFVTGWLQNEGIRYANYRWGRPAEVQQLPDGSLLVSDDGAHTVYRITYTPPTNVRRQAGH